MRIERLNIKHFLFVFILILVLPVLKEWKILLQGERIEGVVVETKKDVTGKESLIRGVEFRSIIRYNYKEQTYLIAGPENLVYEIGKIIPLIVHPEMEDEVIIANLAGFYIHRRSIALIVVLILWIAIYTTIVQLQQGTVYKRK
jgi:hypothetical protein